MLTSTDRETWKSNGLAYADRNDLYGMPEKAVQVIETLARTLNREGRTLSLRDRGYVFPAPAVISGIFKERRWEHVV